MNLKQTQSHRRERRQKSSSPPARRTCFSRRTVVACKLTAEELEDLCAGQEALYQGTKERGTSPMRKRALA